MGLPMPSPIRPMRSGIAPVPPESNYTSKRVLNQNCSKQGNRSEIVILRVEGQIVRHSGCGDPGIVHAGPPSLAPRRRDNLGEDTGHAGINR